MPRLNGVLFNWMNLIGQVLCSIPQLDSSSDLWALSQQSADAGHLTLGLTLTVEAGTVC